MSLYLTLELCSITVPLILSFDRKVGYYRHWPVLFPSILLTGALFIIFDIYFAKNGIWGFNPRYHSGLILYALPVEEWLFFIIIPYSSIFIHYVIKAYFPQALLADKTTRIISLILIAILILSVIINYQKAYTVVYFSMMIIVVTIALLTNTGLLGRFYLSFLLILIPFILINGILTGSFIEEAVVWYNSAEIIGLRILTIPVEDFAYGFSLILINLMLMNCFRKLFRRTHIS